VIAIAQSLLKGLSLPVDGATRSKLRALKFDRDLKMRVILVSHFTGVDCSFLCSDLGVASLYLKTASLKLGRVFVP